MRAALDRVSVFLVAATLAIVFFVPTHLTAEEEEATGPPLVVDAAGTVSEAVPIQAAAKAVIDVKALALAEHGGPVPAGPYRTWMPVEREHPAEAQFPPAPSSLSPQAPAPPMAPSPGPVSSFMGLDDIPMADSLYIVIPPDVGGAVGPDRVMEAFNNDYRIQDKATGATISTVGTATFWASVVDPSERLSLTDPRTLYDPYNQCWIAVMQTVTSGAGKILVGVSQTSDPGGAWYLYSFNTNATVDFPIVGFNKNWISVSINRYSNIGFFQRGINLVVDYPAARAGTGSATLITHANNTHFCSAPAVTYSATAETLYVVSHLSSSGATYEVDAITGSSGSPTYTSGGSQTRTGGGWVNPSGNLLPQSAPNAGSSACGATPCKLEIQDAYVRSAPVYRDGFLYYTQTIGLPSSSWTHSAVQWTKLAAPGGAYSDGGRIDDPTATNNNGGKWYAYPHVAVNAAGDFLVGYSQFSSAQHPSAGYSVHLAGDAAGTLRDPQIYHAGEDYYHKTFSTAGGRNRWGDFSTAQVDPTDDTTLWTLQEYAKARTGTNDGNTGANSSRWSTWWVGVYPVAVYSLTATAGPGGAIDPAGEVVAVAGSDTTFTITPDPCYRVDDVLVDGNSVGPVTSWPFADIQADHTIEASFAPAGPDTIFATAGPGGTISPADTVEALCGSDTTFTITPDPGFSILDVAVDGNSVGTPPTYPFTDIEANHTIHAAFTDATPPSCQVDFPNGGDTLSVNDSALLAWTTSDNDTVLCVDLLLSRAGTGGPFDTLAVCLPDTGHYAWTVTAPPTDHAVLRIVAHDGSGNTCSDDSDAEFVVQASQTAVAEEPGVLGFSLSAVSPNPARGSPILRLTVPSRQRVRVTVYDVTGREVAVLTDRDYAPGRYEIAWNTGPGSGSGRVSSGLYFIRAAGPGESRVLRMLVTH